MACLIYIVTESDEVHFNNISIHGNIRFQKIHNDMTANFFKYLNMRNQYYHL